MAKRIQLTESEIQVIKSKLGGEVVTDEQVLAHVTEKAEKLLDAKVKEVFDGLEAAKPEAYKCGVDPIFWLWQQYNLQANKHIIMSDIEKRILYLDLQGGFDPMDATLEEAAAMNRVIALASDMMDELNAYDELGDSLMEWFKSKYEAQGNE